MEFQRYGVLYRRPAIAKALQADREVLLGYIEVGERAVSLPLSLIICLIPLFLLSKAGSMFFFNARLSRQTILSILPPMFCRLCCCILSRCKPDVVNVHLIIFLQWHFLGNHLPPSKYLSCV